MPDKFSTLTSEPPRHLCLDGAANFRDLGGYRTADGRYVAWRRLFRSDALSELSQSDLDRVAGLGLRTVYDLRHEHERRRKPDRIPGGVVLRTSLCGLHPGSLFEAINLGRIDARELKLRIVEVYKLFPTEHVGEFRRLFEMLLDQGTLPAVIHCTSGKDRTGFAVAVIFMALGIPRETIVLDYLLSNAYRRNLSFLLSPDVGADIVSVLSGVDPIYLQAAFQVIDDAWGSEEIFLEQAVGIGAEEQRYLRTVLLEPASESQFP